MTTRIIIYVVAGRKNPKLIVNENEYELHVKSNGRTAWRCTQYHKLRCKAKVITSGNTLEKKFHHNHSPKKPSYEKKTPLLVKVVTRHLT
ncbi:hypothetical protein WA026_007538 [Henosepilachna vigintioctopunctata]|uniref:FLYWCH-type domain-containing protein n=1 Tax=Henosepilachna vigintioctopunctata TaxID=420089 RepID=A0AAW1UW42_9CUCU